METFPLDSLEQRITAGLALKGGSRGSLTRCVGRLGQLAAALDDHAPTSDAARLALQREIQIMHVEIVKLVLVAQRQRAELDALPATQAEVDRTTVQDLRTARQRARDQVACQREYETLAKVAATRYPTPRRVLQAKLATVDAESDAAATQLAALEAETRLREAQFAALVQCLQDFKQSLTEPVEASEAVNNTTEAMEVDQPMSDNKGDKEDQEEENDDDEEGALYEGL